MEFAYSLDERAKRLGISPEDLYYLEERDGLYDDGEDSEEISSEVRLPFFSKKEEKERLKVATQGILTTDPSITQETAPTLSFMKDLGISLTRQSGQSMTATRLPSPFDDPPTRVEVDVEIDFVGRRKWKFRDRNAYDYSVDPDDKMNAYSIPFGATLRIHKIRDESGPKIGNFFAQRWTGSGEEKVVHFSPEIASEIKLNFLKNKKKKTDASETAKTSSVPAKPFKLKATGGVERMLVLPSDVASGRKLFSVVFPLGNVGRAVGIGITDSLLVASGGAIMLSFSSTALSHISVLRIPRTPKRRTARNQPPALPKTAPPPLPSTAKAIAKKLLSGAGTGAVATDQPAQEYEKMTTRDDDDGGPIQEAVEKMAPDATSQPVQPVALDGASLRVREYEKMLMRDDKLIKEAFATIGTEKVTAWYRGARFLGEALGEMMYSGKLDFITTEGDFVMRARRLRLLSETVRSGIHYIIENTESAGKNLAPKASVAMAAALYESAIVLRWFVFSAITKDPYMGAIRSWSRRRGMISFSIDKVANFTPEYFALDFTSDATEAKKTGVLDEYIALMRTPNNRLVATAAALASDLGETGSGPPVFAFLLRDYLISLTFTVSPNYAREWPEHFEKVIFVLLAAASEFARHSGISSTDVYNLSRQATRTQLNMEELAGMQNEVYAAWSRSKRAKNTESAQAAAALPKK